MTAAGAAVWRTGGSHRGAREIVRGGELGDVRFCRMVDAEGHGRELLDFVHFVLDEGAPVSVGAQTMRATLQYPGFVASYERASGGEGGVWFCGSEGTLRVNGDGLRIWHSDGRLERR